MENQLDKLFKDKLASHTLAPPADAWAKIEAGLAKKNNKVVYWRIAAGFLLLGLLTAYYVNYRLTAKENVQELSKAVPAKKKESTAKPSVHTYKEQKIDSPAQHEEAVKTESVIFVPSDDIAQQENTPKEEKPEVLQEVLVEKTVAVAAPVEKSIKLEITLPDVEDTKTVAAAGKKQKSVVLEYTLDATDEPSETVLAQKEKATGLKKVWAFAKDLNTGESEFSLRNMKNELFAFDFKKDKTKKH